MQIFRRNKKKVQHDSPQTKPACCFSFHYFFPGCLYRVHKLTSHFLHRLAKYCRRAAKPVKSVIFPKNILPFVGRLQAARFPYSDALHIFPQNTPRYLFYVFFACKTQSPPGRSRLASLSTNLICRIFSWDVLFFLKIFFNFFSRIIPS